MHIIGKYVCTQKRYEDMKPCTCILLKCKYDDEPYITQSTSYNTIWDETIEFLNSKYQVKLHVSTNIYVHIYI